jgi:4-hydroxy-tetrahydrodipicolinate reductase
MMETTVDTIKIAVVGAAGRMGSEVLRSVGKGDGIEPVLAIDRVHVGEKAREIAGPAASDLTIEDKLGQALDRVKVDVIVDLSHHSGAVEHALTAIKRGVSPVIGATGMSESDIREIKAACRESGVPGMYIPNFAIGAVLMMRFAEMAAAWLPHAEIIELHHDRKEDAPSGTSILTAEKIAHGRGKAPLVKEGLVKFDGARGGVCHGVHVHSVRLPGFVAHQQTIFGGVGETLTIRHDSIDRSSFMEGVKVAVRHVRELDGFVVGLDKILFETLG